jgi:hypothetical protein
MANIIDHFTNTQLFWLFVLLIIMISEVVKALFDHLFRPLQMWMRAQNRKALRDKFAAHAMQGLITFDHSPDQFGIDVVTIEDVCHDAYRYADKMMEVRKEVNNG